jgi:hypothetical protein
VDRDGELREPDDPVGEGTTAQFRFRVVTKSGVGDWSLPTSSFVN